MESSGAVTAVGNRLPGASCGAPQPIVVQRAPATRLCAGAAYSSERNNRADETNMGKQRKEP